MSAVERSEFSWNELFNKLQSLDVGYDVRMKALKQINAIQKYDTFLTENNITLILTAYSVQILDDKMLNEIAETTIMTISNIFQVAIKLNLFQTTLLSLKNILDSLFKIFQNPKRCKLQSVTKKTITDIVDNIIILNDPKSIILLSNILKENVHIENVVSPVGRKLAMRQLQNIQFPNDNPLMNDIFEKDPLMKQITERDLPPKDTNHRLWFDIVIGDKTGPSDDKTIGDEYRAIFADAISNMIMDPNRVNGRIGINIADLFIQKNNNFKDQLNTEAKQRLKFRKRPLPKKPLPRAAARGRVHHVCVDVGMDVVAPIYPTIGFSVGGAKDVNNFRECIENGMIPSSETAITYNGIFYEYYFDTSTTRVKHNNNNNMDADDGSMLFYPSYCYAQVQKVYFSNKELEENKNELNDDEYEYYLSVGLNSNIRQQDFKRKHLNLVILLDISGSMNCKFRSMYMDKINKLESAKHAIFSILKQLTPDDALGIVTFESNAQIVQKLQMIKDLDMNTVKDMLNSIKTRGGTDFESGYKKAVGLYAENMRLITNPEYDNRIIVLTDAEVNQGRINASDLLQMMNKNAAKTVDDVKKEDEDMVHHYPTPKSVENIDIFTTFIGVGLDFNSQLIDDLSKMRGCNYYSVKSTKEFEETMNEEFEYMVTPMVFNVCLKLKCEGNGAKIEKVYGPNDHEDMEKTGEITKIHTLFPSKKSASSGETKGGIQLIKLKIQNNDNNAMNIELEVTFEDRNGKKYKNTQSVTFEVQNVMSDMIATDEKDDDFDANNFYDNLGIRKAILLCKYVELMKQWIKCGNENPSKYQQMFEKFKPYFKSEMTKCNDESLKKEVVIIDKLSDVNKKWEKKTRSIYQGGRFMMPDI